MLKYLTIITIISIHILLTKLKILKKCKTLFEYTGGLKLPIQDAGCSYSFSLPGSIKFYVSNYLRMYLIKELNLNETIYLYNRNRKYIN